MNDLPIKNEINNSELNSHAITIEITINEMDGSNTILTIDMNTSIKNLKNEFCKSSGKYCKLFRHGTENCLINNELLTTNQVLFALPSNHPIPDTDTLIEFVRRIGNGNFTEEFSNMYGNVSGWDVSLITDMCYLFAGYQTFNEYIGDWDVSNVTNMRYMFYNASTFNQSISNWDVSNVINMNGMFYNANNFNQSIINWDVSNVTEMRNMFYRSSNFNQSICDWDVSNVTNMKYIFDGATNFNMINCNWLV